MAKKRGGEAARETSGEQAPVVRIFLSSPGDVADERKIARELIERELQKHPSYRELKLVVIAWDDPDARIPMLANETPQESVNNARPRPSTCDIVIVILWARMGTPLPETIRKPDGERYLSGTEWEYLDAVNSRWEPKPDVLVYRGTEEPMISIRDPKKKEKEEQFERVEEFFARFRNTDGSLVGGVNEYAAPDEFKALLRQHLEELFHRRLPAAPASGKPRQIEATIPHAYLDWLRVECADVSLLGHDRQQGQALTLSHVYVPALTARPAEPDVPTAGKRKTQPDETAERIPVPLLQRLDAGSLYVPAPAGAGKSTFCRWAVLQSIAVDDLAPAVPAPEEFAETAPMNLRGRLPLLVPLRDFHERIDSGRGRRTGNRRELEETLAAWVDQSPLADRLTGANLLAHLRAGTAFLLLDGLDEVPVFDTRDGAEVYPRDLLLTGLGDALPAWLKAGNRVLLTSRPYGLDEGGLRKLGLPQAPLEPLPEPLQDLFIARWFHALDKAEQMNGLIATIRERDDLGPLAENPMMLTALCVLWDSGGRLPEDRYELYRRIVDNVLFHRFRDEVRQREPARARLEAIAHGMHVGDRESRRESPAAEISYLEIDHILRAFADDDQYNERGAVGPVARREELLTRSGLLLPRPGDRAAFYHLSVQEFLAASRILRTEDDLLPVFRARGAVAGWRPTLLFLFAGKIGGRTPRWGTDLLARLVAELDRAAVRTNPAPAVFIAEALDLCLAKNYAVPEELKEVFRGVALNAIEDEVELRARQALGVTLGRVGDPRIFDLRVSQGNVDLQAYVEVPAGTYPYGDEGRTVEIMQPFWIGRYPVTNQQFAAFIAADGYGYGNRQWWSKEGWAWLQGEKAVEPRYWHDRRWNAPNQPVVGVSFWEAEAFCAWAGGRLPTEEEWEAAARGPRGLVYPWGDGWQHGICATSEAGLGATSPVGLFPRARQADRAIDDLAGNVWEWCASLYDPKSKDSPDDRVLRGGSWNNVRDFAPSARREDFDPRERFYIVGFRVVRCPQL
ncbi:MAG TPA: SUMF1/EgtB/PvdO family nonheme iron enzyme [Stellaceae bacterium]|jgi:formylglycine-generating enzyme required for sulfatase activity